MIDTQTMTLCGTIETPDGRVDVERLASRVSADGFTVVSVTTIPPPAGAQHGATYRIVATYPAAWALGGWRKGRA